MTITEWFARAVAAGLAPDWDNVWARTISLGNDESYCCIRNGAEDDNICTQQNAIDNFDDEIQLREDGIDLYRLEWRKPTKEDIGKRCWFTECGNGIKYGKLGNEDFIPEIEWCECSYKKWSCGNSGHFCSAKECPSQSLQRTCLLADHGQVAPIEQDFKRIYGADND